MISCFKILFYEKNSSAQWSVPGCLYNREPKKRVVSIFLIYEFSTKVGIGLHINFYFYFFPRRKVSLS